MDIKLPQCSVVDVEILFDGVLITFSDERSAFYSTELLQSMLSRAEDIGEHMAASESHRSEPEEPIGALAPPAAAHHPINNPSIPWIKTWIEEFCLVQEDAG
jgi:hypothetical protein